MLSLLCALAACSSADDTCTGGDNMSNPRIADGFDPRAATPELQLLWDRGTGPGAGLPASYFDAVRVSDRRPGHERVVSATHVAAQEIRIRLSAVAGAAYLEDDVDLSFTLEFPDRELALDCTHPGTSDSYLVEITLQLRHGTLAGSSVRQTVQFGDI